MSVAARSGLNGAIQSTGVCMHIPFTHPRFLSLVNFTTSYTLLPRTTRFMRTTRIQPVLLCGTMVPTSSAPRRHQPMATFAMRSLLLAHRDLLGSSELQPLRTVTPHSNLYGSSTG